MNRLNLLDTTVTTDNLGDLIIYDSIVKQLDHVLEKIYVTNVSTHDNIGDVGRVAISSSPLSMLLGTNALTSKYRVNKNDMWRLTGKDVKSLAGKTLLCGVGWRKYQSSISFRQKRFYQKILHPSLLHAVRDEHSAELLKSIGINNVINTTCPTAWSLTPEHCAKIATTKAERVVFTLTRHKPAADDEVFINYLLKNYQSVYFWPQQIEDADYLQHLISPSKLAQIRHIAPSLKAYDGFLADTSQTTDFIGTRLHGGIRAMQYGHRSLIIAVDNRATEIARDIHLPIVQREDTQQLLSMMTAGFKTEVHLPDEAIRQWKLQFEGLFAAESV